MWTLQRETAATVTATQHTFFCTQHNIMQPFCLNCWFSQFYMIHTFIEKVTPSRSNFALAMHPRGRALAAVRYAYQRINLLSSEKKTHTHEHGCFACAQSLFVRLLLFFFLSLSEIPVGIFSHSIQLSLSFKSVLCSCNAFFFSTVAHQTARWQITKAHMHTQTAIDSLSQWIFPKGHNEHGDDFYWIIMCCVLVTVDWAYFKYLAVDAILQRSHLI